MRKMKHLLWLLIFHVISAIEYYPRPVSADGRRKVRGVKHFWEGMLPHNRPRSEQFIGPRNVQRRQLVTKSLPQVLMTQCPLNSRCVSRNFCDRNGMITTARNNNLNFEEDDRGFIACVDSVMNVLGVCCTDIQVILDGGRPVRQDDVFQVTPAVDFASMMGISSSEGGNSGQPSSTTGFSGQPFAPNGNQNTGTSQSEDPVVNAINQENILPKVDDGNGPLVVININAENADIDGDINKNPNVQTNVNDNTINNVPDPISNNPFIPQVQPTQASTEPQFNLSPEDVLTILDIMNDNRNNINNNNNVDPDPIFRTCPAATVCVDISRCDFNGVLTDSAVSLSPRLVQMRVALNRCESPRRQTSRKVCCRDPNYSNGGEADEQENDFGNDDYMDFDEVFMYPYNPPKDERLYSDHMTTKKPKRRRTTTRRPLPAGPKRRRRQKPRKTLEFFTNG
eukprot:TRINITY_DN19514_c0_g1_i1.p1 TRINITY_DN19514_c0_g1~~TRINITY_DN19514_c0_g1_i1.p1  ORF type:complete len:453 (-),score=116.45 TRINITY_DN19514_c0_g1_i1:72-1430(-)